MLNFFAENAGWCWWVIVVLSVQVCARVQRGICVLQVLESTNLALAYNMKASSTTTRRLVATSLLQVAVKDSKDIPSTISWHCGSCVRQCPPSGFKSPFDWACCGRHILLCKRRTRRIAKNSCERNALEKFDSGWMVKAHIVLPMVACTLGSGPWATWVVMERWRCRTDRATKGATRLGWGSEPGWALRSQ